MKQNLIFKIAISALISALLVCISFTTIFIRISDSIVIQFSDGIFMSLVAIISGKIMLIPAIIYPMLVDLSAGVIIYIPISILIRLLMFMIIKFSKKYLTSYGAFFLAGLTMFLYLPFTYILFREKGLLATEAIVDLVQVTLSVIIAGMMYFSISKSDQIMLTLNFGNKNFSNSSWLFSDYDGTVSFDKDSNIDNESLSFINNLINAKNNNFVFATGRLYNFISVKNSELSQFPKYTICGNGSLIYSKKGKINYFSSIPNSDRKSLVEFIKKYKNLPIDVAIDGVKIPFHYSYNPNLEEKRRLKKIDFEEFYDVVEPLIYKKKNVTVFYLYTEKNHQNIIDEINTKFSNLRAFKTSPYIVEIINKNVSKWSAIEYLIKKNNIDPERVFTCGDGENDFEMLEKCINSAKMIESSPKLESLQIPTITKIEEIKDLTTIFGKN
ncbi:HAD-IIB family hydrolase [Spiroplasma alleghenense]|nr:HAD-IIB family hydrolase [Spiroplasma alleghenense]